ncbi:MAG: hypothetical protein JJT99_03560 [Rhodobacteraceae bacterium]|nr:hypothetical protein [Paracoccaceae bacterium]
MHKDSLSSRRRKHSFKGTSASLLCGALMLGGCADSFLDDQEQKTRETSVIKMESSLRAQSRHALQLSDAYAMAARRTTNAQDLAAFVTFLSAGAVVAGAVSGTSSSALAYRGLGGAVTNRTARRTVPKSAIKGMYTGAKRLNCISAAAEMGVHLLSDPNTETTAPTILAARAYTFAAINQVRLTTRESIVRDVADFNELLTGFREAVTAAREDTKALGRDGTLPDPFDTKAFTTYVTVLAGCLDKQGEVTAPNLGN